MATRMKTVQYAFTTLASLANNTLTNLTQLTISLPESSKVFKSVVARISCDDIVTATGGSITTKSFGLRVGAAAYTTVAQTTTITNSGENISFFTSVDFTSQFATNFTGTSHTCDFQLTINQSTGTTLGMVNVCVTLEITYEYDDTSATQIKTIYYPLKCNPQAMSQATVTEDTIPALSTLLPEASKVFRNIFVVIQGNQLRNASTVDSTMTLRVGAASVTTGIYEGALATNRFTRYVWNLTSEYPNTAASQTWQPTNSLAGMRHHQQAWLAVTYEYNEAATTRVMNSVMLPIKPTALPNNIDSLLTLRASFGGIQEDNVTTEAVAFYGFWNKQASLGNSAFTIFEYDAVADATISTVYADTDGVFAGSNAMMWKRKTPEGSFTQGQQVSQIVEFDVHTGATPRLLEMSGYFLGCYTSDKSSLGSGAHNHTVLLPLVLPATGSLPLVASSANPITLLPVDAVEYHITGLGVLGSIFPRGALPSSGSVRMWAGDSPADGRPLAELGTTWSFVGDTEVGCYCFVDSWKSRFKLVSRNADNRSEFTRLQANSDTRFNMSVLDTVTAAPAIAFLEATAVLTYHEIYGEISGTLTGAIGAVSILALTEFSDDGDFTSTGTFVDAPATSYTLRLPIRNSPVLIVATDSTGQVTRAVASAS